MFVIEIHKITINFTNKVEIQNIYLSKLSSCKQRKRSMIEKVQNTEEING